jgi:hypothetical protein
MLGKKATAGTQPCGPRHLVDIQIGTTPFQPIIRKSYMGDGEPHILDAPCSLCVAGGHNRAVFSDLWTDVFMLYHSSTTTTQETRGYGKILMVPNL